MYVYLKGWTTLKQASMSWRQKGNTALLLQGSNLRSLPKHNKNKSECSSCSFTLLCPVTTDLIHDFTFPCFSLNSILILWGLCWCLARGHQPTNNIKQLLTGHLSNRHNTYGTCVWVSMPLHNTTKCNWIIQHVLQQTINDVLQLGSFEIEYTKAPSAGQLL